MTDRRFVEETFPVKEVGEEAAREKSIRHGHISTLHIWWARRPLASSRAIDFAALIPVFGKSEENQRKKDFIVKLSKWDNSLNRALVAEARKVILESNGGKPPKVLDPFAGGGAIPLEALRLGCETYASDYNPVATLLLKCTLEYPEKFGVREGKDSRDLVSDKANLLLEDVERWGNWVLIEAKREIERFYPQEKDGSLPVGFIWARTISCQNPSCNAEIPLMRQFWLSRKSNKRIALFPNVVKKEVKFEIVGTDHKAIPRNFNPDKGTISRAIVTCLVCGSVAEGDVIRSLFVHGKFSEKMVVVILDSKGGSGKRYRLASDDDVKTFRDCGERLNEKRSYLRDKWGFDPVPDEPLPDIPGHTNVYRYGMTTWGALFNQRQKLSLITFSEKIRQAHEKMLAQSVDEQYAKAVITYLCLNLDRLASYCSSLGYWHVSGEKVSPAMARQALAMVFDYAESNPLAESFSWITNLDWIIRCIESLSQPWISPATVVQGSATSLNYRDGFFDAVFTDPPYYDNVPYAVLSDFFYVWLKRSLGHLYPELFATPLTPKNLEIVAHSKIENGMETGKEHFESLLRKAFMEIHRVLKPNGIAVIVYAHKSTAGWESLVNSLLDSDLVVTGAWPIHTEMKARLVAKESAALASSIYIVARKMKRSDVGFYREVKDELANHLTTKLNSLWREEISGADFLVAAIGSSIEVFGKYDKIIDDEGNPVRADKLLDDVRRVVTDYAVKQVLHNGFSSAIEPLTRFYVLWRWAYGESEVLFDDARKLAQSVGIDLTREWNKGFIRKNKEFISVLGPEDRKITDLEDRTELIDVLHKVLLLWKKGRNDDVVNVLKQTGFGKSDTFYRVAQAISESLRNGKEKKLLEGFLSGKGRITEQVINETGQTRLF